MATESVQTYALEQGNLESISMMLLDAIKAKSELDTVRQNIEDAAKHGITAKQLVLAGMLPREVDLDITETAEMLQLLSMLPLAVRLPANERAA